MTHDGTQEEASAIGRGMYNTSGHICGHISIFGFGIIPLGVGLDVTNTILLLSIALRHSRPAVASSSARNFQDFSRSERHGDVSRLSGWRHVSMMWKHDQRVDRSSVGDNPQHRDHGMDSAHVYISKRELAVSPESRCD